MKQGKLTNSQLQKHILNKITLINRETVVGAGIGEDCCAIDTGGMVVVSTDPITAASAQAGSLAIHINANDIASAGAVPVAALVTILIPTSAQQAEVDKVVSQLTDTAQKLKIDITGGHTEVTDSVNRIVVSVTMLGKPVVSGKIFRTADMHAGNDIVMTKYAGMEGTTILADDYKDELKDVLDMQDWQEAEMMKGLLSVVPEGTAAARIPGVTAMHDITEGGVINAVFEMCEAARVTAEIDFGCVPVMGVTRKICDHYGLDVYGLISSGSMLIAAEDGELLKTRLNELGIVATVIGKAVTAQDGENNLAFQPKQTDELYKVIDKANRK